MTLTPEDLFAYPEVPLVRRHAPSGYTDYGSYKPWVRDDFDYRCVYCLMRERWSPDGQAAFSIDHVEPRSLAPSRECDYTNLIYACLVCNSSRQYAPIPDPCRVAFGTLVRPASAGRIEWLSPEGERQVRMARLNRPTLIQARLRIGALLERLLRARKDKEAALAAWFGWPDDLPDLAALRPPGGNALPAGVTASHHARRLRGELPDLC